MKIVEGSASQSKIITLNEIAPGQTFRGTIVWKSGRYNGTFYKVSGAVVFTVVGGDFATGQADVVVVRLDAPGTFTKCATVENYEPLDVELVVKGVQK